MPKKNVSGMTLMEVIIAIAILSIVVISILGMLTSGFRMIARAGWNSVVTFDSQAEAEETLILKNTDPLAAGITITFPSDTITCPGKAIKSVRAYNGLSADVWFFQPKN